VLGLLDPNTRPKTPFLFANCHCQSWQKSSELPSAWQVPQPTSTSNPNCIRISHDSNTFPGCLEILLSSRTTTQPPMSSRIILILAPTYITLQIMVLTYHSSCPPRPPLSRTRPAAPTLALLFDFLPPSSLYISRMSTLLGRDTARASLRHCSSFISLGDW